jgi:TonB-dependent starch-binding outer membrane protein SusC
MPFIVSAQQKTVNGKITSDKDGSPISGATILAKGSKKGTQTAADGSYILEVPAATTKLVISSVGFGTQELTIGADNTANLVLKASNEALTEVVVIGYGTARKKDLTGSISSVKEKEFNRGLITSPDQLIQGKAAGVQITSASGAPNAGISVRIRGNSAIRAGSEPLYVVDGIQLSGGTARPGSNVEGDLGGLPGGNPLSFLNPSDIASIDVLKDASATAIYGSRGSNGVVIITTKKGQSGSPRIDFGVSFGTSKISKKIKYASAAEYRAALTKYGITTGDLGGSADGLDAVTQKGKSKNYSIGMSGGNDFSKYRLSLGYFDQTGIILKTGLVKYNADFSGQFKFLESKKLLVDVHILANQNQESIAPISNNGGFRGSLIGAALQWNPTRNLYKPNGLLDIDNGGDNINPVGLSQAYDDKVNLTNIIASIAPSYKILEDLEYKVQLTFNQGKGTRRQQIRSAINLDGYQNAGWGRVANAELTTTQITHTLNYNKKVNDNVSFGALVGYEYIRVDNKGSDQSGKDFGSLAIPYYDGLSFGSQGTKRGSSFFDPTTELQSYFIQANLNFRDKYLLRATFRRDGSNKFGADNKYGNFPSISAAWNIDKENFLKNSTLFSTVKLRAGWGQTGNQDFPAGSAVTQYIPSGPNAYEQRSFNNASLKWQTDRQTNVGLDLGVLKGRVNITVDYFDKNTKDLLVSQVAAIPSPGTRIWKNIAGNIKNKGVEITINAQVVKKEDFNWNIGFNTTLQKNIVDGLSGPLLTGGINGQGLSGAFVQRMTNGQPLNVFYVRKYNGIKADGQADIEDDGASFFYMGSGIPTTLLGINTSVDYKKISLQLAFNGAYGHKIYNNTANAVLPINNLGNRNISTTLLDGPKESTSSPITTSSRYLEKGNFLRLANATLNYNVGKLGKAIKGANIFVTGQNLFVITKFTGFDPEVNVDKNIDGVPSFGIEYTPYPSARTFIIGLNFSL